MYMDILLCIHVVIVPINVQEGMSELRVKLSSLEQSVSSPPITCTCYKEPTLTATSTAPPSKLLTLWYAEQTRQAVFAGWLALISTVNNHVYSTYHVCLVALQWPIIRVPQTT